MEEFILIVDDNIDNLKVLGNILKENNYKIALSQSGKDVFDIMENISPMVILLDIMMPEMDGFEVLRRLKDDPDKKDIPVIMVTAKDEAADIERALDLGAVDYLTKPVNKIELLARLRSTLKLRENELALKEMLKSKEEFIHMVAHDLRTPFASITGFADMLMNDENLSSKMNTEHKEYLQLIVDSSTFLVDYFNKLLNWASIEANGLTIKKEKVNLKSIVQTIHLLFSTKLADKQISLINSCTEDFTINADSSLFQQIINNLLSNAIKYTPENGRIFIFTEKQQRHTNLIIRDTGVGISNMQPDELFKKSFHKSTKGTKGEKGTGVGLHICKIIADAHSFGLTFKPAPEKGTDFIISIPND
jgi:two-component system, sensor histidine kinase and response regulator